MVPAHVHLLPGVSFRLGEVACSTRPRIHPEFPTIYEQNAAWTAEFLPAPTEQTRRRMLEMCYPAWDTMVFPDGIADRVFHTSRVTPLMFEVDDLSLLQSGTFDHIAEDWAASGHPYGRAFADVFTTFERHMAPRVFQRYRNAWRDWYPATKQEVQYRKNRQVPDLDTYLAIRNYTIGMRPYIVSVEYVLDHDLTDVLAADPDFGEAVDATVHHVLLVNDLFSLRTEAFGGEWFNTVLVIYHHNGGHLQDAVDQTRDLIADADRTLTRLTDQLRDRYPDTAIHAYLDTLHSLCSGNLCWYHASTRYHGTGNAWNGLRTGTVTLSQFQ